jgi:hypothetical protein
MLAEHYIALGLPHDAQVEVVGGKLASITPTQSREITAVVAAGVAGELDDADPVRSIRTLLLSLTDYTQAEDAPLSAGSKAAWATYRQALRDLPDTVTEGQPVAWPTPPGADTTAVPASVSARQIRLWLVTHGITLAAVEAAIDAIPDATQRETVRIEWEYAPYILRSHPMLIPLAAAFSLTSAQVDAAFTEAATL